MIAWDDNNANLVIRGRMLEAMNQGISLDAVEQASEKKALGIYISSPEGFVGLTFSLATHWVCVAVHLTTIYIAGASQSLQRAKNERLMMRSRAWRESLSRYRCLRAGATICS